MASVNVTTTRRATGESPRTHPLANSSAVHLRAQAKGRTKAERARVQTFRHHSWARQRLSRMDRLTKLVPPATPTP